jgi:hypothetical protein
VRARQNAIGTACGVVAAVYVRDTGRAMSQENADVIRGAFDDWNGRDWEAWKAKHDVDMVAVPPKGWRVVTGSTH